MARDVAQGIAVTITIYDLAAADAEVRFSPYCWRTKLALAHKDLPVRAVPWRFTDKQTLRAATGAERVPALIDGTRSVADSWGIAADMEQAYPDRLTLFGGAGGLAHARFINAWADAVMIPGIARLVVHDVWRALEPADQDYFRSSREARFGTTLEAVTADRERTVLEFREALLPLRLVLRKQAWLGGAAPSYADYIAFGGLQWARCISSFELLAEDDPVWSWRERVLDLFAGLARSARRAC